MVADPRAVVGLDLSLTGAGVAWWHDGDQAVSVDGSRGGEDEPLAVRYRRIHAQAAVVERLLPAAAIKLAVIEAPANNAKGGKPHDRAGLWWTVVGRLLDDGIEVVQVPPTQLKRFGAGTGNASKMTMMAKAIKRYPDVEIVDDNAADAMFLLEIARRLASYGEVGTWLDGLPDLNDVASKALTDIQIMQLNARRGR